MYLWLELILLLGGFTALFAVAPPLVRWWMKADKQKRFSDNHINEFHKTRDWALRITALAAGFILFPLHSLVLGVIIAVYTILSTGLQAYVEWKYTGNPSNYKASLLQLICFTAAFVFVFGWISMSPTFA
ncbi:DUF4181 domain-containing protein [Salibacterium halotolerans]|uniref:DUF4181 domain-containing protein n=1 Tax=Salibacterium halotolerans TaxID=1884432 RepID=A0A1I5S995_9BACI|nr:DUF4181 domain-containing protein [Salibacterium halotolerans]SFP67290.1 protein of unknown function [Salibacterium halotolerans]